MVDSNLHNVSDPVYLLYRKLQATRYRYLGCHLWPFSIHMTRLDSARQPSAAGVVIVVDFQVVVTILLGIYRLLQRKT